MKKKEVRVSFRLRGPNLEQILEVQEVMGLNTPGEAYQYLALRGLEAISGQLVVKKTFKRLEGLASPDQMLPLLQAMTGEGGPTLKPAEKVP